ncbi:RidA family protein [Kordiimonas sp. SCSIO 12610]|uniref:RidA family protein n=1 Tax=Kordiimonas sp. SCSIO 12610 TaxID=2829597 RepID=UPI002108748C|nr:RidA family protein [Kordiimonas sp. SCSIO 12610]UTW55272.1 RidA family protein [Kordiimonas sp. SCSIO 12610]
MKNSLYLLIVLIAGLISAATPLSAQDLTFHQTPAQKANNAPYSEAVTVGNMIFFAGQVPRAEAGEELPSDIQGQAHLVMKQIAALAEKYGSSMDRVAKCTVFLTDIREWASFNEVYVQYFKPEHRPARSAFEVGGLGLGYKLEVECIAVKN